MPTFTSSNHTMSPEESYGRLDEFLYTNQNNAMSFTVDDDNHGMGLLCAHLKDDQTRATTVRLNKHQIGDFMRSHGFKCESPSLQDPSTAIRCVRPPMQQ
ncbi:hypothetical protein O0I10_001611 [Lichtheimia ornata]|uniref:Uncharacterized protein n=1 Tax=Lichtheimia ornata TaxID=688661 RepID=A0AAD7Y2V8_9FUNG|nr:uncharacterized protein O0I10_001611 [Lichtheimia ornata]KAJ8662647.1 hypothetical protein O0I10_001611 [Lichtheimia ornata]